MSVYTSNRGLWRLKRYSERYAMSAEARQPLLLLPGWSCDSRIFDWLVPGLAQHFVIYSADILSIDDELDFEGFCQDLAELFFQEVTQPAIIMGWSLGGNVAVELAHANPLNISALQLLACAPSFVASESIPNAMSADVFVAFQQLFNKNSKRGLRRFDQLQLLGLDEAILSTAKLAAALQDYRALSCDIEGDSEDTSLTLWQQNSLSAGLRFLAENNQAAKWQAVARSNIEVEYLLADNDALVSAKVAEDVFVLTEKLSSQSISKENTSAIEADVLSGANHLFFLTHTDRVYASLLDLQQRCSKQISEEKQRIALSFSKAASAYDASANVQKRIASTLLKSLQKTIGEQEREANDLHLVDAGCGTGFWTAQLAEVSPHVTGVDIASGMLSFAKAEHPSVAHWLCDDLENMQLLIEQTDFIFSSLAVQWCETLEHLLSHWYSLLRPGGQIFLATLGPKTLYELDQSFQEVDDTPHVNRFLSWQSVEQQLSSSPLEIVQMERVQEVEYYDDVLTLMHDLKNIGAQTVIANTQPKPLTKTKLTALKQAYEYYRNDKGKLPANYDVFYLQLRKPS